MGIHLETPSTDEIVHKCAETDYNPQGDCDQLWPFVRQLERELIVARDELADWHNAAEQVKAEHPDEVHCSCVAILRKQLKDITEQRNELLKALV